MTASHKGLIAASAVSIAAAVLPTPSAAGSAATRPSPPRATAVATSSPRCTSSGLVVWIDTNGNGAAGSIIYSLKLTNLSGHRCTLRGYPGVSAVNLAGGKLGRPASRFTGVTPRLVSLARGATATALLKITDVGNYPAGLCRPVTAAGLRVYPPGQSAAKLVPFPFGACSRSGPVYLSVRAVTG